VTGHCPVSDFRWTLVKHDFGGDERSVLAGPPGAWNPQRPTRKETRGQFAVQPTAVFDVKRLVDGLMTDAHGAVIRKIKGQSLSDLLWTPGTGPAATLSPPMPTAVERDDWPRNALSARHDHLTRQAVLYAGS